MKPQITLTLVRKDEPDSNEALNMLWPDATNQTPDNVPSDAYSWYVAIAWHGDKPLASETGLLREDAVENLFVRLHRDEIEWWLASAEERS